MTKQQIDNLFDTFKNLRVLIIGDIMIDSYLWGDVNRISPEAPVPVVECKKRENRLGGAANVALNIHALGAVPILCSVIGDDDKSKIMFELLKDKKISCKGITKDKTRRTTIKFRIISRGQQIMRIDEEDTHKITSKYEHYFVEDIQNIIEEQQIDVIIFEDYDKGVITKKIIEKITKVANNRKIPTLVDPKRRNFKFYKNVTLFKPNLKELADGLKLEIKKTDFKKIYKISKKLAKDTKNKYILTTLSESGVCISSQVDSYHVPAEIRDIIDVSGAGDTVIATAALCLANNLHIKNIAEISNIAGGLVCEKVGVVTSNFSILKKEVKKYYNNKNIIRI